MAVVLAAVVAVVALPAVATADAHAPAEPATAEALAEALAKAFRGSPSVSTTIPESTRGMRMKSFPPLLINLECNLTSRKGGVNPPGNH